MSGDFISQYLDYTNNTEPPAIYHRWSIITALAAYMGRTAVLKHGHFSIYPNLYTILLGGAGTRKNTSINIAKTLIRKAGYKTLAASKTTKEKLFIDMSEQGLVLGDAGVDEILNENLFGGSDIQDNSIVREIFIAAGEFNTFFGNNILDFLSDLGELWDWEGPFDSKIKNGKSVIVHNPTINILGGNTPTMFAKTFPPEFIGQGFFSRCILVYGERTREKITFPPPPDPKITEELVRQLKQFRKVMCQEFQLSGAAKSLIDKIYHAPESLTDPRFESYYNRRLTVLFKLCLIIATTKEEDSISEATVLYANTILTHVEYLMPRALGEFGRAKNSDIAHKVLQIINNFPGVCTYKDIFTRIHGDLEKYSDLGPILEGLANADKIQPVPEKRAFLPKRAVLEPVNPNLVNFELLTAEERGMSI
jgi:hypothetical protein